MIVNLDRFQLMFLQKSIKQVIQEKLQIEKSENSMTLLGINIDNRLSFDDHISKLFKKHPCN